MKSPVSQIKVTRAEGPAIECGISHNFSSFEAAQAHLAKASLSAPSEEDGGYDKVDFVVRWENGQSYSGRYDLTRGAHSLLSKQIASTCAFYLGSWKPNSMDNSAYARFLTSERAQRAANSLRPIYETCEF